MNLKSVQANAKEFNLQRFIRNRRFLLLAILMMVSSFGLLILVILPRITQTFELQVAVAQQQDVLKGLQKKVSGLSEVTYLQAIESAPQVDLALPSQKPLLPLIGSVNSVARTSSVTVTDIEISPGRISTGSAQTTRAPGSSAPPAARSTITNSGVPASGLAGRVEILTIAVRVKGTLGQINQFVDELERVAPVIDITAILLERQDKGSQRQISDQYESKLTLSTYYFTQALNVSVDAPLPDLGPKEQETLTAIEGFIFPEVQKQDLIQGGGQEDLFKVNAEGEAVQ